MRAVRGAAMESAGQGDDRGQGATAGLLRSPVSAAVFTMLLWAATTIVVRYLRHDIPPIGLSFWRTFSAFLIVLPFAARPLLRQWDVVRRHLRILALLALLLWVGGNALLFLALQYTIAINAAVINSVEPVFIMLLAALLFGDRLSRRQAVGVALSLAGVLALISAGSIDRLLGLEFNRGDLIVTCAYVSWGLYAVLLRKLPHGLDHRVTLLVLLGFGAAFLLPVWLLEAFIARPMPATAVTVLTVVALAALPCALATMLWNHAIARLGAIRAGQYLHLIPAFTVLLAIAFLGEVPGAHHIGGIVLIAGGLYLASPR